MSRAATILRQQYLAVGEAGWEPLKLGELNVGDRFIGFPIPGDNEGHGGFRRGSYLFTVKEKSVKELGPGMPYHSERPHDRVVDERGVSSDCPQEMFVIKIT